MHRLYVILMAWSILGLCLAACAPPQQAPVFTSPVPQLSPTPDLMLNPIGPSITPTAIFQKLRVSNQSNYKIQHLVVRFPQDQVDFGVVPSGATTAYYAVPHGVYRYAAYDVLVNGQVFQQPVMDWMGESPMIGTTFTYILDVDPAKWTTEGWVIQLVDIKDDTSTNSTPIPTSFLTSSPMP